MVNNINIRISNLKEELNIKRSKVIRLRREYMNLTSPSAIEERAMEKLNMRYPSRNEVKDFGERKVK